jgi:hypothetical protein
MGFGLYFGSGRLNATAALQLVAMGSAMACIIYDGN